MKYIFLYYLETNVYQRYVLRSQFFTDSLKWSYVIHDLLLENFCDTTNDKSIVILGFRYESNLNKNIFSF